jgi:DNA-binding transcriptional LysR family regulator
VIDVRHLRYFVAVSEELHFGRAAERLHITQPPLSQAIRKLEDELGVELLQRTSRVVTLTDAGRVFAKEARAVIAAFDRAVAEARRSAGSDKTIHIGCVPYLPVERLLAFLAELRRHEPGITVQVTHLFSPEQVERLRGGGLDVGMFIRAEEYDDLELETLYPGEPGGAFLAPSHPLTARPVLTPSDLSSETFVSFPKSANPALYDVIMGGFENAGYRFAEVREAGGPTTRDLFLEVAGGSGVALAMSSLRNTGEAAGLVVHRPLDPPVEFPETVVAWMANPSGAVRAIVDVLRTVANDLRLGGPASVDPQ